MTEITGIPEMREFKNNTYGATINDCYCQTKPKHFETIVEEIKEVPWLAEKQEWTFMNRNNDKPPVETYKTIELKDIPQDRYLIFKQENFDEPVVKSSYLKWLLIIIAVIILLYSLWKRR